MARHHLFDGQHFPSGGRARGVSTVNLRYGGEPGVKFHTHVSDQFTPFATRAVAATAAEAPHVLDALQRHGGRMPIREHNADTGGFSDHVFALCAPLGYPRMLSTIWPGVDAGVAYGLVLIRG